MSTGLHASGTMSPGHELRLRSCIEAAARRLIAAGSVTDAPPRTITEFIAQLRGNGQGMDELDDMHRDSLREAALAAGELVGIGAALGTNVAQLLELVGLRDELPSDVLGRLKPGDYFAYDTGTLCCGDILYVEVLELIPPEGEDAGGYRVAAYCSQQPHRVEDFYEAGYWPTWQCLPLTAAEMQLAQRAGWPCSYASFRAVFGASLALLDHRGVPVP